MQQTDHMKYGRGTIPDHGRELVEELGSCMDINTFDIDGVIYQKGAPTGIFPGPRDILITGRPASERDITLKMLRSRGIDNIVIFNPLERDHPDYSRVGSGRHKARTLVELRQRFNVMIHFEDDEVQADEIKKEHPDLRIIHCTRFREPVDVYDGVNE